MDDINRYGKITGLNSALAKVLEDDSAVRHIVPSSAKRLISFQDPIAKHRASFMIAVTVLHELMDWLKQKASTLINDH